MAKESNAKDITTIKTTINTYDDGTVVTESKEIKDGKTTKLPTVVHQNKMTRKKQSERLLVKQEKSTEYIYGDGSRIKNTRVWEVKGSGKNIEKTLVGEYVTTSK